MDDPTKRPPVTPHALPPAGDPWPQDGYQATVPYQGPPVPPPAPYPMQPVQPAPVQVTYGPVPSLPGMPPIPPMGGVSVQISNVVGAPPPYPVMPPQHAPLAPAQPGVMDMIRNDASQRAMDAVARRGPARVLSFVIGGAATFALLVLLSTLALGASVGAVMVGAVPLTAIAVAAFVVGARAGRGVASHHLEQAILELASKNGGTVRVVSLAQATGRPLRECQTAIDAMVSSGHATVEADDTGSLVYRVPDLEPRRRVLVTHGTEVR